VRRIPVPLRLLLVVAAIEVLAWTVVTAPFQAPDEAAHYAYTQYFAETGHKPSFDGGRGIVSRETDGIFSGFNLYTLKRQPSARPFWTRSENAYWHDFEKTLTAVDRKNGSGPNSVAKNPPLYYAYEAIPYRASLALGAGPFGRLFWMRVANGLLFLLTVALTWLVASELFASVLLRAVTTATVVLLPIAAFMGGAVNPDSLLTTIFAAALLVALRLLQRGFSAARVIGLLALTAASLLTHGRGLPLIVFAPVALLLAWHRHRPPLRRVAVWAGAGLAILVAGFAAYRAIISGSGGGGIYGGELRFAPHFSPTQFASFIWQFYLPKLPFTAPRPGPNFGWFQFFIQGYLPGSFGGEEVRWSTNLYRLAQAGVFAALVALIVAAVSLHRRLVARWDVVLLVLAFVLFPVLFLHLASYRAVVQSGATDALIVGRYLLPLTPALGLAVALILRAMRASWQPIAAGLVVALGLLLQLGALGLSVERFYG
jgi:4-amino-4-deoxy-L-arabinose transferase-like glycosyltransferase